MSDKYEAARILGMTKNIAYDGYSFVSEAEQMALRVCELEAENAELREEIKALSKHIDAIYKNE